LGEITEDLEHEVILELAGPITGRSVLDVGCGDGTLLRVFRDAGAAEISGCDADPRMVSRARARLGQDVMLEVARGHALPFADARFDIVTCITVLAFIPDAASVVSEMARVLRPGGALVIGDLNRWSFWAARRRIRGWLGHKLWRDARFRTAGDMVAMLRDAGLAPTPPTGAIFFPPWTAAARRMARWDRWLGRRTTLGAAFFAVAGRKPEAPPIARAAGTAPD